jgi:DNA (cytosine-5)-methyltransferase 1
MLRAIREIKPKYVVGENVRGIISWNGGLVFDEVQADLETEGYTVIPCVLPACGVNAPHRRERVWFIAYRTNAGTEDLRRSRENEIHGLGITPNTDSQRHTSFGTSTEVEELGRGNDGKSEVRSEQTQWDSGIPGLQRTSIDTNNQRGSTGLGCFSEADGEISQRNENAEPRNAGELFTSDTDLRRCNNENEQVNIGRGFDKTKLVLDGKNEPTTNTKCERLSFGNGEPGRAESQSEFERQSSFSSSERDAANLHDERLEGRENDRSSGESRKKRNEQSTRCFRPDWQNFPTQPPICGGDDGLSRELDGITFPKWRSESIKAYGNAIVPAVAFEIFKVINEIDNFLNENSYLL